ncbi:DUF962 domain-containing protein [Pseudomonas sp. P66]|jgi:uncharacterized membrane protein YGL010W|uniref:DUF962 domain-containing protein n=1 Tax=Pseudomonas arcuscaelestis TaxID=2710591 RepID=A0ABS2C2K4_9PSED|nr:Mpo1-like protein [Pseudomonas arcuscaelestis]MBM5460092.1 DUF962 domain-containing protein [Pseudomonas arcuscaelestis]
MKNLVEYLSQYAAYHRDPRNIATHFVGIPMIVVAVTVLLSRPGLDMAGVWLSPALLVALLTGWFYLRLDQQFGLIMALLLGLCLWAGQMLAQQSTVVWLSAGLGLFVLGWIIQFVGHHYEGRKPAFVDDLSGLIVGPLFVVAELAFVLGMRPELKQAIENNAGPVALVPGR